MGLFSALGGLTKSILKKARKAKKGLKSKLKSKALKYKNKASKALRKAKKAVSKKFKKGKKFLSKKYNKAKKAARKLKSKLSKKLRLKSKKSKKDKIKYKGLKDKKGKACKTKKCKAKKEKAAKAKIKKLVKACKISKGSAKKQCKAKIKTVKSLKAAGLSNAKVWDTLKHAGLHVHDADAFADDDLDLGFADSDRDYADRDRDYEDRDRDFSARDRDYSDRDFWDRDFSDTLRLRGADDGLLDDEGEGEGEGRLRSGGRSERQARRQVRKLKSKCKSLSGRKAKACRAKLKTIKALKASGLSNKEALAALDRGDYGGDDDLGSGGLGLDDGLGGLYSSSRLFGPKGLFSKGLYSGGGGGSRGGLDGFNDDDDGLDLLGGSTTSLQDELLASTDIDAGGRGVVESIAATPFPKSMAPGGKPLPGMPIPGAAGAKAARGHFNCMSTALAPVKGFVPTVDVCTSLSFVKAAAKEVDSDISTAAENVVAKYGAEDAVEATTEDGTPVFASAAAEADEDASPSAYDAYRGDAASAAAAAAADAGAQGAEEAGAYDAAGGLAGDEGHSFTHVEVDHSHAGLVF
eukprot:tig00000523_g1866.t1